MFQYDYFLTLCSPKSPNPGPWEFKRLKVTGGWCFGIDGCASGACAEGMTHGQSPTKQIKEISLHGRRTLNPVSKRKEETCRKNIS